MRLFEREVMSWDPPNIIVTECDFNLTEEDDSPPLDILKYKMEAMPMTKSLDRSPPSATYGLQGLIEGAQIPILESDKDMLITSANSATSAVFGYAPDELLGQKVNVLMLPRDDLLHDGYIEAFNRTGLKKVLSTVGRRVKGRRKDGTELTLLLTTSSTPSGYAAVFVDLTEQIATECSLAAER